MTDLIYVSGNILKAPQRIIGHGCNARGVMGKGVAAEIKKVYPDAYQVYREKFEREGLELGEVIPWVGDTRIILNLITQETYGHTAGVVYVDYNAVRMCMQRIEKAAQRHQANRSGPFSDYPEIALPRIGSGYGGGEWDVIAEIITAEIKSVGVTIYSLG